MFDKNDLEGRVMEGCLGMSHMKEPGEEHTAKLLVQLGCKEPRSSEWRGLTSWFALSKADG